MNVRKFCVIGILVSTTILLALVPSKAQDTVLFDQVDLDGNGLADEISIQRGTDLDKRQAPQTIPQAAISIGMIETGGSSLVSARLTTLGYSVTLIPPTSGISTFRGYDIVYLPSDWALASGDYATIEANASGYRNYVYQGGSLFIDQPSPYGHPGDQATPTLLPYPITFYNWYVSDDYPPTIVDPDHDITRGLQPRDLPFPADRMISVDPFYHTLVVGSLTGSASLVIGEYGGGRILVQTAHPSYSAGHPFSDEAYVRMIEWVRDTQTEFSISGYIRDCAGNPIRSVIVSAGSGASTFTDGTGAYTIANLAAGTYTLTPTDGRRVFTPSSRIVFLPPDATGRNFMGYCTFYTPLAFHP